MIKFIINAQEFYTFLNVVAPATKNKNLAILSKVRLTFNGDILLIKAFDLTTFIQSKLEIDCKESFDILVDFSKLAAILKKLKGNTLISISDSNLVLRNVKGEAPKFSFKIPLVGLEGYTRLPKEFQMSFKEMSQHCKLWSLQELRRASAFTSPDLAKGSLAGVCVTPEGEIAATDAHRLIKTQSLDFEENRLEKNITIPATFIKSIDHLFLEDDVKFGVEKNIIAFETEEVRYVTNLVGGIFPPYQKLIPKEFSVEVESSLGDWNQAISLLSLVNEDKIILKIKEGNKIELSSFGGDSEAIFEIPCSTSKPIVDGSIRIGFNLYYLQEAVKNALSDFRIQLGKDSVRSAVLFLSENDTNKQTSLLMPVLV